jgi:hypothetical protein
MLYAAVRHAERSLKPSFAVGRFAMIKRPSEAGGQRSPRLAPETCGSRVWGRQPEPLCGREPRSGLMLAATGIRPIGAAHFRERMVRSTP